MRIVLLLAVVATLSPAQAPDDLIHKLGDEDFEVREVASKSLEEQGEAARAALLKAQDNPDAEVRQRVALILRELDRKAAARVVAEQLQVLKNLATPAFDAKALKPFVEKQGNITGKETWTADRSYRVTGDVTVQPGAEWIIEPGTIIVVAQGVTIRGSIEAKLNARGTAERPIVFTSWAETQGQAGHWGNLLPGGMTGVLTHAQIRRSSGVRLERAQGPLVLDRLSIYETNGDALTLVGASPTVQGLVIREATGTGLVLRGTTATVLAPTISRCAVGVAYTESAYGALHAARLADIKGEAIRVTASSYPRIEQGLLANVGTGLVVAGASYPTITGTLVAGSRGDGIVVAGGSYPNLNGARVVGATGWGLAVKSGSYPTVGLLETTDCRAGNQLVEPNCRIRGPGDSEGRRVRILR